jgi:hypothetical protein
MASASRKVNVTIVGGGIAGLTAALRLAQSGCQVTLYEEAMTAGGNVGAERPSGNEGENTQNGTYHDLYPHMYGHWYNNFWKLAEDLGLSRERDFEPMPTWATLRPGEFPSFKFLINNGSIESFASNLMSGIIPIPDGFLLSYSIIDLLSQDFGRGDILSKQTVNGFIASRPYATKRMAEMYDVVISNIWGVNSYLTSALAYQRFAKYQIRHPVPQCWVLKGNAYDQFIKPLTDKLVGLGCKVNAGKTVHHVTVTHGKVDSIGIKSIAGDPKVTTEKVDNLVLAIPPKRLAKLVLAEDEGSEASEYPKHAESTIVAVLPQLSQLRRIRSEPIPVLDVSFRRRLTDIPRCYVSLMGSPFQLTFVEIPQLSSQAQTVLSVAAPNYYALPEELDTKEGRKESQYLLLKDLQRYIPFNLGNRWGDPSSDIDWNKSFFRSNKAHPLFINEVGSEQWCPKVNYPELSNLFFAGDYCQNMITIATVEAAVVSGLQAARALVSKEKIDKSIEIIEPDYYPESFIAALKIALAPYALAAKCWSASLEFFDKADDAGPTGAGGSLGSAASLSAEAATAAIATAMEWWDAMQSIYGWRKP